MHGFLTGHEMGVTLWTEALRFYTDSFRTKGLISPPLSLSARFFVVFCVAMARGGQVGLVIGQIQKYGLFFRAMAYNFLEFI